MVKTPQNTFNFIHPELFTMHWRQHIKYRQKCSICVRIISGESLTQLTYCTSQQLPEQLHILLLWLNLDQGSLGDYVTVSPWTLGSLSTCHIANFGILFLNPDLTRHCSQALQASMNILSELGFLFPVLRIQNKSFTHFCRVSLHFMCSCSYHLVLDDVFLFAAACSSGYGREGNWFRDGRLPQRCKGGKETGWVYEHSITITQPPLSDWYLRVLNYLKGPRAELSS